MIYIIGGSPCSGKSTITEIISRKHNLKYFKVDDYLDKYIEMGAKEHLPVCSKIAKLEGDDIWMREPENQNKEEFAYYREIFKYILDDIKKYSAEDIIVEGAAYLPELIKKDNHNYLCIVPTFEFQMKKYSERSWISQVLKGCKSPDQAFSKWMQRDALFAEDIIKQCEERKYKYIINDGSRTIDDLVNEVEKYFELK